MEVVFPGQVWESSNSVVTYLVVGKALAECRLLVLRYDGFPCHVGRVWHIPVRNLIINFRLLIG